MTHEEVEVAPHVVEEAADQRREVDHVRRLQLLKQRARRRLVPTTKNTQGCRCRIPLITQVDLPPALNTTPQHRMGRGSLNKNYRFIPETQHCVSTTQQCFHSFPEQTALYECVSHGRKKEVLSLSHTHTLFSVSHTETQAHTHTQTHARTHPHPRTRTHPPPTHTGFDFQATRKPFTHTHIDAHT